MWKLISLRETDLNGWCIREPFVSGREQDFERERGNKPISASLPLSLSIFFFFFSSKIPPFLSFFSLFLFLNTCFLFLGFEIPNPLMLVSFSCTWQRAPFILPTVTRFYYFGPQQPLSGLSVLANHHWSVCVPLPIAR